jgi:hypothetical protein
MLEFDIPYNAKSPITTLEVSELLRRLQKELHFKSHRFIAPVKIDAGKSYPAKLDGDIPITPSYCGALEVGETFYLVNLNQPNSAYHSISIEKLSPESEMRKSASVMWGNNGLVVYSKMKACVGGIEIHSFLQGKRIPGWAKGKGNILDDRFFGYLQKILDGETLQTLFRQPQATAQA